MHGFSLVFSFCVRAWCAITDIVVFRLQWSLVSSSSCPRRLRSSVQNIAWAAVLFMTLTTLSEYNK
eukprot:48697-Amphidinium_carterae.1